MPELINFVKKINGNVLIVDSYPITIASLSPNQSVYIDETNANRFIIKSNVNPHEKGLTIDVLTVSNLIDEINNTTMNFQGESRETIVFELATNFFFEVNDGANGGGFQNVFFFEQVRDFPTNPSLEALYIARDYGGEASYGTKKCYYFDERTSEYTLLNRNVFFYDQIESYASIPENTLSVDLDNSKIYASAYGNQYDLSGIKNLENEILGDFKMVKSIDFSVDNQSTKTFIVAKKSNIFSLIGIFIIKTYAYDGLIISSNQINLSSQSGNLTFENKGFKNDFHTNEEIVSKLKISPIKEDANYLYFKVYTEDLSSAFGMVEIYYRGYTNDLKILYNGIRSDYYREINDITTIAPNYTSLIGIPKESITDPKRLVSLFLNQDNNTIYKGHNLKYIPFFKHAIDVGSITSFGIGDKLDLADGQIVDIGNGQTTTASITNFITNRHNIIFIGVENDFNKLHSAQIYSNEDNQLLIFGHFRVSTINGVTTTTDFVEEISFNLMKGLNNISFPTVATSGNVIACLLKAKIANSDIFLNGGIYMYNNLSA